ncbi:MAG: HEAT repeat domain-containing protein, partial [Planctomycetota bacterium]|nr:HEAT repeat domain-containing protein [Planctomycetota bacterium]
AVSVLVEVGSAKEVTAALSRRVRVEKDATLRKHIVKKAGDLSDSSAGKIAEAVIPKGDDSIRRVAFDALESLAQRYPKDIARILSKFMSNSNESITRMAIHAARKCKSSTITKKLSRIAEKDGKMNIRTAAINSLGFHAENSRKIISSLERFGKSPQAAIRYASVQALVGRSKNVRYFEKLLDGKDPEIQAAAIQGLIQMQTRASGKVFISLLKKHSDPSMRILAARALGKYGWDKSCKKAISDASKKDRSPLVRAEAGKIYRSL